MESADAASKETTLPQAHFLHHGSRLVGKENPLEWASTAKWTYTVLVVCMAGIIGFSSSVHTPAIEAIAAEFHVSKEVSTLGASTYLVGFGTGPFIFAPLSELMGRNPIYRLTFFIFCLAQLACALSPSVSAFLVFRFIAGFFGSPTVSNSGGSITDLWPRSQRSVPFALFTAASFCGPVLAPIIGGFLTQYVSWHWNFWLVFIISGTLYIVVVVALPETYAPKLQNLKAACSSGNAETLPKWLMADFVDNLVRPWRMLFTEPILFSLSLYMAFIYGVLFLDFTAYPIVFQRERGWSLSISGLSFLGIGAGMALATALSPFVNRVHSAYVQRLGPQPEARLPHLIFVAWLMPVGLFWFGWTALPPTHWISSILAGIPFGFGLVMLFLGINSYLTDCYDRFSASALAANSMLRSLFGAGFALFADIMYDRVGTPWATSILGFIALAMAPMPFIFYRYGPRLRAASKYHLFAVQL